MTPCTPSAANAIAPGRRFGSDDAERLFLRCRRVLQQLTPSNCEAVCRALMPQADMPSMLARLAAIDQWLAAPPAGEEEALAAALRLLEDQAMPWLRQGRLHHLAHRFDALPETALQGRPRLQAIALWVCCLTAGPDEAMARLSRSSLQASSDPVARGLVEALWPTMLGMLDRHEEAYAYGSPLLRRLAGEPRAGSAFADATLVNAMANAAIALGRYPEARRLLDDGRRAQGREPSAFGLMHAESTDGIIDLLEGRLKQATARFEQALQPPREGMPAPGQPPARRVGGGNAWVGVLHAATVYERGDLDQAAQLLQRHLPPVCDAGLLDHMVLGHLMQARIAWRAPGPNAGQAEQVLAQLEALGHQRRQPRLVASAQLERARIAMLQGDAQRADAELARAGDPAQWQRWMLRSHLANDLESLPLSRLRRTLWLGDGRAAARLLPQIEQQARAAAGAARHRRVLLLHWLAAMASFKAGDAGRALKMCSSVLSVCAREGFVRLVVDEGPLSSELLRQFIAVRADTREPAPWWTAHARRLLEAFGPSAHAAQVTPWAAAHAQRLTPQELRMLQGVAEGLRNDALAARHGVSRNTVRTHLRHVSAKLGAHNRTEAVNLARRHGWLG